jgi:hypothetical protein
VSAKKIGIMRMEKEVKLVTSMLAVKFKLFFNIERCPSGNISRKWKRIV